MAWDHLSITKPHLVYIILGGFTSIFMLVSLFVKEKLYIGEATVATITGVIFGPHCADLINPLTWGNTDEITLEFSRIVLVVQCFAVGVELPKSYMERHWKSVVLLLVPVMTFGWLITSLFIWWMIVPLTWLESLCVAACVTATDPVLASSVVGKGKFAKRVPKHIRDILSAESGCNDGMAFPFIYLAIYLIEYHLKGHEVTFHWFVFTILYECIFGAIFGVLVGYIGRHAIRQTEKLGLIDRESFLAFYFVLALFCAGAGSLLGLDDLLVGFAAGVGFSNDGWFTHRTEETHVSSVIDLLLNLAYFVYFGTIIPWDQFNAQQFGLEPWRLVVIAIFVILFRRIPVMMALKPIIPDVKTWREALFCGHFGPIGVGAIFVAILARAELESGNTIPLAELGDPNDPEYNLIYTVWPIVTFLVIASIIVHGSSIAVFTLGKRINTLTMTLSYTTGNDQSSSWMNRLPRISSQSKSMSRMDSNSDYEDEKLDVAPGQLPPIGIPKLHLRRQKDEDYQKPGSRNSSRSRSRTRRRKRKTNDETYRYGGPVSASAIMPARRSDAVTTPTDSRSEIIPDRYDPSEDQVASGAQSRESSPRRERDPDDHPREDDDAKAREPRRSRRDRMDDVEVEAYEEGNTLIVEDEEGNVVTQADTGRMSDAEKATVIDAARAAIRNDRSGEYARNKDGPHARDEGEEAEQAVEDAVEHPREKFRDAFKNFKGFGKKGEKSKSESESGRKRGPAHAYQFGNTIIVEDEDGEVIKTYTIPRAEGEGSVGRYNKQMREGISKMSALVGLARRPSQAAAQVSGLPSDKLVDAEDTSLEAEDNADEGKDPSDPSREPDKNKKHKDEKAAFGEDDGLRMVISDANQYSWTGLQKHKAGSRPGLVGAGGRRLSTKDFLTEFSRLDPKNRAAVADANPDTIPDSTMEVIEAEADGRKSASGPGAHHPDSSRPNTKRTGSTSVQRRENDGYFAQAAGADGTPDRPSGRGRSRSDAADKQRTPGPYTPSDSTAAGSKRRQPPPQLESSREDEEDELDTIGEEDVPVHNVRSAVARHGKGMTAAELRRQQYRQTSVDQAAGASVDHPRGKDVVREKGDGDDDDAENDTGETAAEMRRRLAALGIGGSGGADSSSDSDDDDTNRPRIPKRAAVPEPGDEGGDGVGPRNETTAYHAPAPARHQPAAAVPRPRIQWGGERRGHVRGEKEDDDDVGADPSRNPDPGAGGGAVGKGLRGLLKRQQ